MILDKDQLKYITQAITPEEATYVAQVSAVVDSIPEEKRYESVQPDCTSNDCCMDQAIFQKKTSQLAEDIIFVNKIQGFHIKIKDLAWLLRGQNATGALSDLQYILEDFIRNITPLIRAANNYDEPVFHNMEIPVDNDILDILDMLKTTYFEYINNNCKDITIPERNAIKTECEHTLSHVCRSIYEFRLLRTTKQHVMDITSPAMEPVACMKASAY